MAGNSPELKQQKKKKVFICYKVKGITQEKVKKEKPTRSILFSSGSLRLYGGFFLFMFITC